MSDELFQLHAARLIVDPPFGDLDRVRKDAAELMQLAERVGTPRARMEGLLSGVLLARGRESQRRPGRPGDRDRFGLP